MLFRILSLSDSISFREPASKPLISPRYLERNFFYLFDDIGELLLDIFGFHIHYELRSIPFRKRVFFHNAQTVYALFD